MVIARLRPRGGGGRAGDRGPPGAPPAEPRGQWSM